jgi:formylmethanofuran:tetrahydromethanopterin formyltransferase
MDGRKAATAATAAGASGSAGGTAEGVESDMPQRLTPDVIDGQTVQILKSSSRIA